MGTTGDIEHAAILFADVKGYSVLVSRDEVGTYERLRRARSLFQALAGNYGGRIVDEAGDGVLAAFSEAGPAVDFALAVQRDLATAAAWQGESGPLAFRIGLHSGPVHVDGPRLFGHNLIVAQRIQEIAAPGRVCVSDAVRSVLEKRVDLRFVSLGWRPLKNLEPMHIHRVEAAEEPLDSAYSFLASSNPIPGDDTSIAMLPLENHSPDTLDRLLCDGVTMDIIERLSRFRDISVIARHSAFQCRSLAHAPNEIAELLGIRYLAVGSMRRSGERLRISAQLLEAETGRVIWSDRFDGSLGDIFVFQDEVADMIAARLASQLSAAERHRILTSRAPEIGAYGLVLRGQDLMTRFRREANVHARHLFEQAGRIDPRYGRLYAGISHSFNLAWRYGWEERPESSLAQAVTLAEEAIRRDELDARGYAELGCARLYQKLHSQSLAAFEHAVTLNPNDADVLAYMADTVTATGQPERAVDLLRRALRLNPCQPDWYLWHLGDAQFNLARYGEAIETLNRMRDRGEAHRLLAASYALLGDLEQAREHAQEVRRTHPEFSLSHWRQVPPDTDAPTLERYFEGLRLAGLE